MARTLDSRLIAAYRETDYRVFADPPFVLRTGARCPALDEVLRRKGATGAAFVTAWNPYSEPTALAINAARQAELVGIVDAMGWIRLAGEGRGADPDWPAEPSILVIGPQRDEARTLGRDFGQHAIIWISLGEPAELDLL